MNHNCQVVDIDIRATPREQNKGHFKGPRSMSTLTGNSFPRPLGTPLSSRMETIHENLGSGPSDKVIVKSRRGSDRSNPCHENNMHNCLEHYKSGSRLEPNWQRPAAFNTKMAEENQSILALEADAEPPVTMISDGHGHFNIRRTIYRFRHHIGFCLVAGILLSVLYVRLVVPAIQGHHQGNNSESTAPPSVTEPRIFVTTQTAVTATTPLLLLILMASSSSTSRRPKSTQEPPKPMTSRDIIIDEVTTRSVDSTTKWSPKEKVVPAPAPPLSSNNTQNIVIKSITDLDRLEDHDKMTDVTSITVNLDPRVNLTTSSVMRVSSSLSEIRPLDQIKQLNIAGPMSQYLLRYLLKKFRNVDTLIVNVSHFCPSEPTTSHDDERSMDHHKSLHHTLSIELTNLKSLRVQNLRSHCPLSLLSFRCATPTISHLNIRESDLTPQIFSYVRQFLLRHRSSLATVVMAKSYLCDECVYSDISFVRDMQFVISEQRTRPWSNESSAVTTL